MPRIGTGQAGGAWFIVEELVRSALPNAGVSAFVYDLPEGSPNQQKQMELIPLWRERRQRRKMPSQVVLLSGPVASGKTTLAEALEVKYGFHRLRQDS